jgi:hypothetical protein
MHLQFSRAVVETPAIRFTIAGFTIHVTDVIFAGTDAGVAEWQTLRT